MIPTGSRSDEGSRALWATRGVSARAAFPWAARSAAVRWRTFGGGGAAGASVVSVPREPVSTAISLLLGSGQRRAGVGACERLLQLALGVERPQLVERVRDLGLRLRQGRADRRQGARELGQLRDAVGRAPDLVGVAP